ncbi:transporter [Croceicoccus hydrothermalis]|uniref:transporter n=1 Tax=Croceicoccus hydrothermalis TaxID=2867964 RepID=UPI001EFB371A|nr:transporter [Croceicoccus hydrothermalis]
MTPRTCILALACAALFPALPALAQDIGADAAPPAQRDGQIIATFYYSNSTRGFGPDGDTIDIPDYEKMELFLLAEYRVTPDLTLVVKPSFRNISVEGEDDDSGLGYTDLGARYRLLGDDGAWLAAEGALRIPGFTRDDRLAQVGNTGTEYDLRLRGFHNIAAGAHGAFVDAQGSYRLREGDPPNEFHADVTLGYRPSADLLIMAQSFNTISDGAGRGIFDEYRYYNVQLGAVQQVSPAIALQAGLMGTIGGTNALRERGFFTGIWFAF